MRLRGKHSLVANLPGVRDAALLDLLVLAGRHLLRVLLGKASVGGVAQVCIRLEGGARLIFKLCESRKIKLNLGKKNHDSSREECHRRSCIHLPREEEGYRLSEYSGFMLLAVYERLHPPALSSLSSLLPL